MYKYGILHDDANSLIKQLQKFRIIRINGGAIDFSLKKEKFFAIILLRQTLIQQCS